MNRNQPDLRRIEFEHRQAALWREGRSPRAFESWAEPPYEILCPLAFHEVPDLSRWDHVRASPRMERGLYLCQPLFGWHQELGANRTPCWLLVSRILLGPNAENHLFRTFWLNERAIERSSADLRRLGLPLNIARQTVEFDRGGVLAVVDWHLNEDDQLPYKISSITSLVGISTLHAEFLDYQWAVRGQTGTDSSASEPLSA